MNRTMDRIILPAGIRYVIGTADILANMSEQRPMVPFSGEILEFLDLWSKNIRARMREEGESFPDAASFAFWCRQASLEKMRDDYGAELVVRLGTGTVLCYAASNVPVLFAFCAAAALLAGNCVILRLPTKETPQERLILGALEQTFAVLQKWRERIVLLRYEKSREINEFLAALCSVRMIWGGDFTVREIRQIPLPVRAREITFPDRSSAALIDAEAVLAAENLSETVRSFYNDTYLNDQNACSSPRIVYWLGKEDEAAAARERFWQAVSDYAGPRYDLSAVLAVKKLEQAYCIAALREDAKITFYGKQEGQNPGAVSEEQAVRRPGVLFEKKPEADLNKQAAADFGQQPEINFRKPSGRPEENKKGNTVVSVWLDRLDASCHALSVPGGFFLESGGTTLEGFYPILTEKCQTVTVFGTDLMKLRDEFRSRRLSGPDRVVPFGHALDFSLIWDGRDLIREMSRVISAG